MNLPYIDRNELLVTISISTIIIILQSLNILESMRSMVFHNNELIELVGDILAYTTVMDSTA